MEFSLLYSLLTGVNWPLMMSIPVHQDLILISYCYYYHKGLPVAILPDQKDEADDDQRTNVKS